MKNKFLHNIWDIFLGFVYFSTLFMSILFLRERRDSPLTPMLISCLAIIMGIVLAAFLISKKTSKSNKSALLLAYTDVVTGGMTFAKFKMDAEILFSKNPGKKYVLFYSDIKNFKYINDVYGFEIGNKILHKYAECLSKEKKICYCRMNADHFISIESYEDESLIVEQCRARIERVSDISGVMDGMSTISISVGAYCTNGENDTLSIDAMIDRANIAQKQLKNNQLAGCILYDESFRALLLINQEMENRMAYALENGEFLVYLQPKFDISKNCIAAAEALVRWNDPERGIISPMEFIPLFEKNGFIKQLDTYMFEQVCKLIRKWLDSNRAVVPISANVSKVQLDNPTFLHDYITIKEKYKIPHGLVEIEFTESVLFDNSERMREVLSFFRKHGFRSSIDDFGAGYSSLNLLKNLPTDILKLDKMFFDENEYQDREKVIIKNVILMAQELSMQTVAEGVEHWEQVEFLRSVKCEMVQGYVFDRPLPVKVFEDKYMPIPEKTDFIA